MIIWESAQKRPYKYDGIDRTCVKVVCDNCGKERWATITNAKQLKDPNHICITCRMTSYNKSRSNRDLVSKRCPACGKRKSFDEFWKNANQPGGLAQYCKECYSAINKIKGRIYRSGITQEQFEQIKQKYGNKCLCCGRTDVPLHADHVVSIKNGGKGTVDNIQPLCESCNSRKNYRNIEYRPDYLIWHDLT